MNNVKKSYSSAAFSDTKPHYEFLDGLRGVAALLVVFYHIFEGYSFASGGTPITVINHGYLAVDFFFILSGFVIGYAYDDRWNKTLSVGGFFKRRLIRLHPMIVMGGLIGALSFIMQGSVQWDGTHISTSMVMLALLCAMFFIPAVPGASYEVRGNGEMFPLNGPSWSLFFEYIGNILYALFIRRLSDKALTLLVIVLGICLSWFAVTDVSGYGMIGVGWTLDTVNFFGGLVRMLFPFSLGMLISRNFRIKPVAAPENQPEGSYSSADGSKKSGIKKNKIRGAFWICSVVLLVLFCIPYIESSSSVCLNGVYEMFCIIIVFPILVCIGASGNTQSSISMKVCKFLGDISYPLYAIHYPIMYLFYSWLIKNEVYTFAESWNYAALAYFGSVILAYICLKLYDEPVRKYLISKFR